MAEVSKASKNRSGFLSHQAALSTQTTHETLETVHAASFLHSRVNLRCRHPLGTDARSRLVSWEGAQIVLLEV